MTPLMDQEASRLSGIQFRYRELGRLRMGSRSEKGHPVKLDNWRLTSASKNLLEAAAQAFGGEVREWANAPTEGVQYELLTESDSLRIAVPPGEVLSQYFELWKSGGVKKRCDGVNQLLVDRRCSCPEDIATRMEKAQKGEACQPATRLSVLLPDVPDIGVWRLESHGYAAAAEIPATFEILRMAADRGTIIPALLRIDKRQVKRQVNGKTQKRLFRVPVIEIEARLSEVATGIAELRAGANGEGANPVPALGPPSSRKVMPTDPPALHSDGESAVGEQASFAAPAVDVPEPRNESGLPDWILALDADDGTIIDAAMAVAAERGGSTDMRGLADVARLIASEKAQLAVAERVQNEQSAVAAEVVGGGEE
jgi:hypothetical protein